LATTGSRGEIAVREMQHEEAAHVEHVGNRDAGLARDEGARNGVGAEGIDDDQS